MRWVIYILGFSVLVCSCKQGPRPPEGQHKKDRKGNHSIQLASDPHTRSPRKYTKRETGEATPTSKNASFGSIAPKILPVESKNLYGAILQAAHDSGISESFSDANGNQWQSNGITFDLTASASGSVGLLLINGTASARITIANGKPLNSTIMEKNPSVSYNTTATEADIIQQNQTIIDIGKASGQLKAPEVVTNALKRKAIDFLNMIQAIQNQLNGNWALSELRLSIGVSAEGLILASETFSGVKVRSAFFIDFVFNSNQIPNTPSQNIQSQQLPTDNPEFLKLTNFIQNIAGNLNNIETAVSLPQKSLGLSKIKLNAGLDAQGNFGLLRFAGSSAISISLEKTKARTSNQSNTFITEEIRFLAEPKSSQVPQPPSSMIKTEAFQKGLIKAVDLSQVFLPDISETIAVGEFTIDTVEVLFEVSTNAVLSVATIDSYAAIAIEFK